MAIKVTFSLIVQVAFIVIAILIFIAVLTGLGIF